VFVSSAEEKSMCIFLLRVAVLAVTAAGSAVIRPPRFSVTAADCFCYGSRHSFYSFIIVIAKVYGYLQTNMHGFHCTSVVRRRVIRNVDSMPSCI